ncbi:MAG: glycosyltransferase family 2 protein [Gemmataceae bacterium]|nr:glycosyltransferase family 2 protein [Gemmataceae bacterium]
MVFWCCAGVVGYASVGYPLLLALFSLVLRDKRRLAPFSGTVSIVLAARNEEANIERRISELLELLNAGNIAGEIIVVSDGSTDQTVALAEQAARSGQVRVVARAEPAGKAAALTAGCHLSEADVLVFADARQHWAKDALSLLLENFADPKIGAVSGDLVLESAPGVSAGVGLYWRLEKWLRKKESSNYAQVGVTGAISAVRRSLFRPIPPGTLLDDVYWPLQVVMQGYRVVHDDRAVAYDRLPEKSGDEFRRKIRTLAGNYQLLTRLPAALLPWRNPVWFSFLSHKLVRLAVPWALAGMLVSSFLAWEGIMQPLFWAQVAGYALGLLGLHPAIGPKIPLTATAASFLVLNAAAFFAFWVWIRGRAGQTWQKIDYSQAQVT